MSSMAAHRQKRSFFAIPTSGGNNPSLPVSSSQQSQQQQHTEPSANESTSAGGIRRRLLSSISLSKIQPHHHQWSSFPRSKSSLSSMGDDYASVGSSIRKWWEWGWAWILSRKPIFASDLEMNEQETKILGSSDRGTWRHVFYKLRSEIRRLITSSDHLTLPQTYSPAPCTH